MRIVIDRLQDWRDEGLETFTLGLESLNPSIPESLIVTPYSLAC